jgi:PPP family 3-phenylpropionic acid transporter
MPGVSVFGPFLWTAYADATRKGERIFLLNTWICALVALLIPNSDRFVVVAAVILLFALFRTPLISLANSMTFRALADRREGFAAVRLWGTIGYIFTAMGSGIIVDRLGLWAGMHGIALTMIVCGLVGWFGQSRKRVVPPPVGLRDLFQPLQNRHFIFLLTASALARASSGPYETFFTIHLERLGLSRTFAGMAWALAAGSELIVMLCWARMCGRASPRIWMIAALVCHPLRWILSMCARDPFTLLLVQLTHAFTFGIFYLAAVQTVDCLVPDGLRASAQGLFASVTFGLGGLVGNSLAGFLYEPLGMTWLYGAAALVSAGSTVLYWVGTSRSIKDEQMAAAPLPGGKLR